MAKSCCDVKVTELTDGYTIEIRGEGVKEKCKDVLAHCCSGGSSCSCC